jgi:N-acetylglucosaminyldiphosphoundecaprenol N-acetyl-beta-D-mannosaminyltransferase
MTAAAGAAPALPTVRVPTRRVLGVDFALTDYGGAMDAMDGLVATRERGYVCAVAVHALMVAQDDPAMKAALAGSTLTVPDGMPIVWALNRLGARLDDRVYGPELMLRYCERCAEQGHRVFLYGGRDEAALEQLRLSLRERFDGLEVVGGYAPPFRPLSDEEEATVAARIDVARPDVLWVGIGVPKQEKWMHRIRPRLDVPVMCAVGAAFDFHAGLVPQAPAWMQRHGLEWVWRMTREPRRLAPRYLRYNPRFAVAAAREVAAARRAARRVDGGPPAA